MKPARSLMWLLQIVVVSLLAACAVTAERFPGTAVAAPVDMAGRWQMTLMGTTSVFELAPAGVHHDRVTSPTAAGPDGPMDASIQVYRGAHYLVVADPARTDGVSVFRVQEAAPGRLRIAALDPGKVAPVLKESGFPVVYKRMWLYDEIALTGPAMETVLALPEAEVFALSETMTLTRQ